MLKALIKTVKITSASFVMTLLTTVIVTQPGQAVVLSPTQQVQQVADWFIGFFTNSNQVSSEPTILFLTMHNCAVSALDVGNPDNKYVHLEQYIGGVSLLRTAFYEFSPSDTGVNLSVFPYIAPGAALGTCDRATPVLDLSNLVPVSCDLLLVYEPNQFTGTNAPVGCPTTFPEPGSTVVSTVKITSNTVNSFDFFTPPNEPSFGTPIAFQRVTTTSEPMTTISLVGMGLVGLLKVGKRHEPHS